MNFFTIPAAATTHNYHVILSQMRAAVAGKKQNTKFLSLLTGSKATAAKLQAFAGTKLARKLVLGLFVAQALVLVFTMRIGIPPDELNHIQFIEYYAHHSLSPFFTHQQPTYNLGDKTREVDYVYHYTMSWLYRILPLSAHVKYVVIRMFSVLFALLAFLALAKLFKELGLSAAVITVSLLILTNLPMVLMMSSAINNDVLVWLGIIGGLLLLLRLWKRPNALDLLWLASLSLIGGLVKRDLLATGLLFAVLGLAIFVKDYRFIMRQFRRFDWRLLAAGVALLLCLGLFSERIGINLSRYGTPAPSCDQVQGKTACAVFWGDIRDQNLMQKTPESLLSTSGFVVKWFYDSLYNIIDIQTQAWRHVVKPSHRLVPIYGFVMLAGLLYGIVYEKSRFAADKISRYRVYVICIALYYIAVQLLVNYRTYQHQHIWGVALNGRYIIPSIMLLAGSAGFYWSKILARHREILMFLSIFVALSIIFGSGLLMMLRNSQLYNG